MAKASVRFYSGYKGEEIPRSVLIDDTEYAIDEILNRGRVFDAETGKTREFFLCRTRIGMVKIQKSEFEEWIISFPKEAASPQKNGTQE